MKGIDRMHITPVIPDGYHGGPIKQLTCHICKRLFYITQADFDRLQDVRYCHECSLILLAELEHQQETPQTPPPPVQKARAKLTTAVPLQPMRLPQPRTIDRDKMTVEQLLEEAKL